jgi:PIN domain nuclease of toxin-antitoxin system
MSDIILDASPIIALLKPETGADYVERIIFGAHISALAYAEVAGWLTLQGYTAGNVTDTLTAFDLLVERFDDHRALAAGVLIARTRHRGLSLADRACLALALELKLPVVTADRAWADLDLGVEIRLIR